MFNVFVGLSLSIEYNCDIEFVKKYKDKRPKMCEYEMLKHFNYVDVVPKKCIYIREKSCKYEKIVTSDKNNYVLDGYFQSYKYFDRYTNLIKETIFKNMGTIICDMKKLYDVVRNNKKTIMIHIRRGDYVKLQEYHTNLTETWYEQCLSFLFQNKNMDCYKIFIFSDDIKYAKTWKIFEKYDYYFVFEQDPEKSLILMTLCDNFIIANSSLSLIGYFLRNIDSAILIAPKQWFGVKLQSFDIYDIVPKTAVLM